MPTRKLSEAIPDLRVLWTDGAGPTDEQLVRAYRARRDDAALAVLVRRHGPLVWGVCRRVLSNPHDAEDAFQATFLVFVRKVASIAAPERLAGWLHGVAHQTALKARAVAARRASRERQVTEMPEPAAADPDPWREARPLLDQELRRLPEKYRVALVLCDLEGLTRAQAARQLGVPDGTLAARVARGRAMLAKRLARRGLGASGGVIAATLAEHASAATVPPSVLNATIRAASVFAAGPAAASGVVTAEVAALTEGVLKTMGITKLKGAIALFAGVAALLALAATGVLALARQDPGKPDQPAAREAPPRPGEPSRWREVFKLQYEHQVNVVAGSADWIAVGDTGGSLSINDTAGKTRKVLLRGGAESGRTRSVNHLRFAPMGTARGGEFLYALTDDRASFWIFDIAEPDRPGQGMGGSGTRFRDVSPDGAWWLESNGRDLLIRPNLYTRANVETDSEAAIRAASDIRHAVFSPPDGRLVAVVTADNTVRLYDRASRLDGEFLAASRAIPLGDQAVEAVAFSKDGARLAVVGANGFARLYDPANGRELAALKGHWGAVHAVAFSPDGKLLATGGYDNTARLWDAANGAPRATLTGHEDSVRSVAFDASGELLITGSADRTLRAWRLAR